MASFATGFIYGAGLAALRCFVVGAKLVTLARFYVLSASANFIFSTTLTIYAIARDIPELAIMSGVMVVLSIAEWCWAYDRYVTLDVWGNRGNVRIEIDPSRSGGGSSSLDINKQKLLDAIKNAPVEYKENPKTGIMEPYMKQVQITDDYKVILRRDIGDFNHGDLDHWNLEVQTVQGGNIKYDLHLYLGDDGNILPFTEDNIYIPKKSPFH